MEKKEKSENLFQYMNRKEYRTSNDHKLYKKNTSSLVFNKTRWKDITNKDKLIICFDKIIDENYYSINLILSERIIKIIAPMQRKKQIDYLRRKININLKNNLGYLPKLILLVADEENKKPHIHGVIEVKTKEELKKIKRVLTSSTFNKSDKMNKLKRYILEMKPIYASKFWLRYTTKDWKNTRTKVFDCFYINQRLTKDIKKYYESNYLKKG